MERGPLVPPFRIMINSSKLQSHQPTRLSLLDTSCARVVALSEKRKYHSVWLGNGELMREFSQTLAHGNKKNEIR